MVGDTQFFGTVIAFLADTLAAHEIGGFKVGVGFALCKCRVCLASDDMIQTKVHNIDIAKSYAIVS